MKTTVQHVSLGVVAEVTITQDTAEAFAETWDGKKPEKARVFYRKLLESMVQAEMITVIMPTLPIGEWEPNQVQWLAQKGNDLFTEATTVPPE